MASSPLGEYSLPKLYLGVDYLREPLFFRIPSPRGPPLSPPVPRAAHKPPPVAAPRSRSAGAQKKKKRAACDSRASSPRLTRSAVLRRDCAARALEARAVASAASASSFAFASSFGSISSVAFDSPRLPRGVCGFGTDRTKSPRLTRAVVLRRAFNATDRNDKCSPRQMSAPPKQMSVPHKQMSAPHKQLSVPPRQMSVPHKQMSAPYKELNAPSKQLSAPHKQMSVPPKQMSAPPKQMSAPPKQMSAPHKQMSSPHKQMSAPYKELNVPPVPTFAEITRVLSLGRGCRTTARADGPAIKEAEAVMAAEGLVGEKRAEGAEVRTIQISLGGTQISVKFVRQFQAELVKSLKETVDRTEETKERKEDTMDIVRIPTSVKKTVMIETDDKVMAGQLDMISDSENMIRQGSEERSVLTEESMKKEVSIETVQYQENMTNPATPAKQLEEVRSAKNGIMEDEEEEKETDKRSLASSLIDISALTKIVDSSAEDALVETINMSESHLVSSCDELEDGLMNATDSPLGEDIVRALPAHAELSPDPRVFHSPLETLSSGAFSEDSDVSPRSRSGRCAEGDVSPLTCCRAETQRTPKPSRSPSAPVAEGDGPGEPVPHPCPSHFRHHHRYHHHLLLLGAQPSPRRPPPLGRRAPRVPTASTLWSYRAFLQRVQLSRLRAVYEEWAQWRRPLSDPMPRNRRLLSKSPPPLSLRALSAAKDRCDSSASCSTRRSESCMLGLEYELISP